MIVWDQIRHLSTALLGENSRDNPSEVSWHLQDMNNTASDFQQAFARFSKDIQVTLSSLNFKEM